MWGQVCSSKRLLPLLRRIRISKFFENFALRTLNRNDYFALRTLYWEKSQGVWFLNVQISIFNERKKYETFFWSKKKSRKSNSHMPSFRESTATGGRSHESQLNFPNANGELKWPLSCNFIPAETILMHIKGKSHLASYYQFPELSDLLRYMRRDSIK